MTAGEIRKTRPKTQYKNRRRKIKNLFYTVKVPHCSANRYSDDLIVCYIYKCIDYNIRNIYKKKKKMAMRVISLAFY